MNIMEHQKEAAQSVEEKKSRKLLTPELKAKVDARVRELLDLSIKVWPKHADKFAEMPTIRYDVKNRIGGMAMSGGAEDWTIRLNLILCFENEEHFIHTTVGHEVAHLVQRVVFGRTKEVEVNGEIKIKKVLSHGKEWREVMVEFGLKPAAYHTYDTSSIQTKPRKRSKRGAILTPSQTDDMMRRLQTGIRRLNTDAKNELLAWLEENIENGNAGTGDDE